MVVTVIINNNNKNEYKKHSPHSTLVQNGRCTQIARRHVILDMLSCNAAQQQHLIPNSFWWIRVVVEVGKWVASQI